MSKADITKTLYEYYEELMTHYSSGSILGVFLYGSQNYQFSWEGSDIDAKAIYIPRLEEIALLKQPVSREYHMSNGAHVEVKDIRLMWQMWKKQNMNFVEILFTDYYLTHKWYTNKWETISALNEQIAHYNPSYAVTSAYYQAYNTLKQGLTGKKVANAMRISIYLNKYLQGKSYKECMSLSKEQRDHLLPIKIENKEFDDDEFIEDIKEGLNKALDCSKDLKVDTKLQKKLDDKMAAFIISLIEIRRGREFSML